MVTPKQLSARLKALRKTHGASLRAVEMATGVSNAVISQIETGHVRNPGFFTVQKIVAFYGADISQLTA